jgi:hypothetical protein
MTEEFNLYGELVRLRRGRGIERPDLGADLGPGLRALCGVAASDRDARVRPRVAAVLTTLAGGLPPDLREAARVAFALDKEYRFRTLEDRLRTLAGRRRYSERTTRRLMDRACRMMVKEAEAAVPGGSETTAGPGWRVTSLAALFRLDSATPELYEMRRIVAGRDLDRVTVRLGLPAAADREATGGLVVDALFGARLAKVEHAPGQNHVRIVLDLPRVVPADEQHEFWLRVVLPAGQPIWPHYAIVPLNPCDSGTVRVRFPPDRPPAALWALDEVPYLDLADESPGAERIRPDGGGDVVRHFTGLREGYGYGVAWTLAS